MKRALVAWLACVGLAGCLDFAALETAPDDGGRSDGGGPTGDLGVSWRRVSSETLVTLRGVGGAGSRLWVVGEGGTILSSLDGGAFSPQASNTREPLRAIWAASADEAWAVGGSAIVHTTDGGASWIPEAHTLGVQLEGVFGAGAEVYAVGSTTEETGGIVARRAPGGGWSMVAAAPRGRSLHAISSADGTTLVAAGATAILAGSGTTWSEVTYPTDYHFWSVWAANADTLFVSGGLPYRRVGRDWTAGLMAPEPPSGIDFYGVHGTSATDVYVVGGDQLVYHSTDGAVWTREETPSGTERLYAVWVQRTSAIAVGSGGLILVKP